MTCNLHELKMKIRKHARDVLMPLYEEHARYLARVIKYAGEECREFLLEDFDKLIKYATCHEVAINRNSPIEMETHENPLGVEREFMRHKKAKYSGRDLAARIIWLLVRDLITNEWDHLVELEPEEQFVSCPVCGETVGELDADGYLSCEGYTQCKCVWYDSRSGKLENGFLYMFCDVELVEHLMFKFGIYVYELESYVLPEKYAELLHENAVLNARRAREIY